MSKTIKIIAVMFILLLSIVIAQNEVFIVDLNYEDGELTVKEVMTKTGYYPDRKIHKGEDYTLDLVSEDEVLYSFKFEVPLRIQTDVINEDGEIEGGVIVLDKSNFALVLPYYDKAKEIKIYDNKNKEVVSKSVVPALGERTTLKYVFGFIIIFIVLYFFFRKKGHGRVITRRI